MAKTIKELKRVKKALGKDLSDAAGKVKETAGELKESALETTAEAVGYVKKEGGLTGLASKLVSKTAGALGSAAGHVGKVVKAGFDTVKDGKIESEPVTTEDIGKEPESIAGKVAGFYHALTAEFKQHYNESEIDPDAVSKKFEEAAKHGTGALDSLYNKIRAGKDRVSQELCKYVPSEEDYVVKVGKNQYKIGRTTVFTKPEIEKVKDYVACVAEALPRNYKGKGKVLAKVAKHGIRSNEELKEKQPKLYKTIQKHIVK